jgi:uroporphyrinogen-III synthase
VQWYGEPKPEFSGALGARGAQVLELAPYVWERPIDPAPVHALLDALDRNEVDALLITSQQQVEHLFAIAREQQQRPRLEHVAIGAQGPVVEAALQRYGLQATFTPEHGHMGALVVAGARHFTREGVTT